MSVNVDTGASKHSPTSSSYPPAAPRYSPVAPESVGKGKRLREQECPNNQREELMLDFMLNEVTGQILTGGLKDHYTASRAGVKKYIIKVSPWPFGCQVCVVVFSSSDPRTRLSFVVQFFGIDHPSYKLKSESEAYPIEDRELPWLGPDDCIETIVRVVDDRLTAIAL